MNSASEPRPPDLYARPSVDDPSVRRLFAKIGGDPATAMDLGGTMSLNLHAVDEGVVLRVHPKFVTLERLASLQELRAHLARAGLLVAVPIEVGGTRVLTVGENLAEVEPYLSSSRRPADWDSYLWMFEAMGSLHRALASYDGGLPEPVVATYGTAASMRDDAVRTATVVAEDPEARQVARWMLELVDRLDEAEVMDRSALPRHIVHGDIRLANVAMSPDGAPVYFDFGFAARRPRIHELAYSLSWMVLRPDDSGRAEEFQWDAVATLVSAYERHAETRLEEAELVALAPLFAAVPLYLASVSGYTPEPTTHLCGEIPFLRIAEWVLAHHNELGVT